MQESGIGPLGLQLFGFYFGIRLNRQGRIEKDKQYTYNIMTWRFLLPTVAMEMQKRVFC
jgi:hypothetical protein